MNPALAEHPQAAPWLEAASTQRWPYSRLRDWLQRPSAAAPPQLPEIPSLSSDWKALVDGANTLSDGGLYCWQQQLDGPGWTQQEMQLHLPAGAQASVLLLGAGQAQAVSELQLQWTLEAGARLQVLRLNLHGPDVSVLEDWKLQLQTEARLEVLDLNLGASLSHQQLQLNLLGERSEAHWQGLALLADQARAVTQATISHQGDRSISRLDLRNALAGRARRSAVGRVKVERHCVDADSAQLCRSLLLSERAGADMRPELEIYADQVQCAHGATCGALDQSALHYLRSRGLDPLTARNLLLESFSLPALSAAPESTQALLEPLLRQKLDALSQLLQSAESPHG